MPPKIPDLWPDDISTEVLTPIAIMRAQISGLERRTQGLLEVDINSFEKENEIVHNFDLIAPSLEGFRDRILSVSHDRVRVYPVQLNAKVFAHKIPHTGILNVQITSNAAFAHSQEGFIEKLGEVLRSDHVRATIESLIAQSNDARTLSPKKQAEIDAEVR